MPAVLAALRRGRRRARRPGRRRRRDRAGAVHRAAGRHGHRGRARRRSRRPVYGVCSLDAIAASAVAPGSAVVRRGPAGGHRRAAPGGLLGGLRRRRPPDARAPAVQARPRCATGCPTSAWSAAAGGAADGLGLPVLPPASRPRSGWPASPRPPCSPAPTPEPLTPLYLRRPDAVRAGRAQAGHRLMVVTIEPLTAARRRATAPGWSACCSPATTRGPRGRSGTRWPPGHHYLGRAEQDGAAGRLRGDVAAGRARRRPRPRSTPSASHPDAPAPRDRAGAAAPAAGRRRPGGCARCSWRFAPTTRPRSGCTGPTGSR